MMWKVVFPVLAAVFTAGLGALVGGLRDIDKNDAGMQEALNFAVAQHNRASNDMYVSQAAEVIRAQSQVVAGIKYVITVKMERTHCRNGIEKETCPIYGDPAKAQPYQCVFTVWSRPWMSDIRLLDQQC